MKTGERGTSIPEFLCEVNSNSAENYYRQCVTLRTELLGPLRSSGPDTSFDLRGFRVFFACTTDRNVRGNRGQSGNGPHHSAETAAGNLQGSGGCCVRRGPFHPSEIGTAYLTHKRVQCLYRTGNPGLFSCGNVPGLVKLRTKPCEFCFSGSSQAPPQRVLRVPNCRPFSHEKKIPGVIIFVSGTSGGAAGGIACQRVPSELEISEHCGGAKNPASAREHKLFFDK